MSFEIIDDKAAFDRGRTGNVIQSTSGEPDLKEEWDYEPEPEDSLDPDLMAQSTAELINVSPSEFTEFAIRMPDKEAQSYVPFSFDNRRYLRAIYDTPNRRTLLKCGRQVEKTQSVNSVVRLFNGAPILAGNVRVGDWLATMATDGSHMTYGQVSWVSRRYVKPCVRIKSRQGHEATIALTHPMRKWDAWVEASNLQVKDRLAVVRRAGIFQQQYAPRKERIRLTAYLLGDGHIGDVSKGGYISFTQMPGVVLNEFVADVELAGGTCRIADASKGLAKQIQLHRNSIIQTWLTEDGLLGTTSHTKFIPTWVWGLSKEDTSLFINRLWATDGHVKQNSRSKYSLEYCSVSIPLIRDLQALLWKFGIPSNIRKNWPNYWKDQGIEQYAYILRIETQEGVTRFLTEIASLGKSEDVKTSEVGENNNRDTYPIEINFLIRRIIHSRGTEDRMGRFADKTKSLRTAGLRETLKYPPTYKKLQQYVDFFKADTRYDQSLVAVLENHIDTDIYWDEIEEITNVGEVECVDFEVEGTHNFVCDGFITHNSTLLGNKLLSYSCIITALNSLYVSPTNQQSKVFSQDRLKEPIETSDYLKSWTTTKLSDNVFLKKFINRSQITLRYAFMNADRCRGIPADAICLDELQDLLTDNIPVIEECASHSHLKIFMYSGTPKSLDNTIEYYWTAYSTQNEWAVPCHRHTFTSPTGTSRVHWNILSEDNLGETCLVCDKCGEPIYAMDSAAQWVSLNPDIIKQISKPYEGYRIPQLMVPWINYDEIKQKQKTYSRPKFYNEVLGLSYDSGTRPLTRQDVIDNCNSALHMNDAFINDLRLKISDSTPVYAGLDWGTGEGSYTVMTLGAYFPDGKFNVFFWKKFDGREAEPTVQIEEITRIINLFKVVLVGCDYGGGFWPNDELTRRFGWQRIVKYQYSTPGQKVKWEDGLKRFLVNRNEVMSDVFNALKRRNVFRLPNWDQWNNPFAIDFLNIFSEYNEQRRMLEYKKTPKVTDDAFHSMLYCFLVSMIRHPRPDVIAPSSIPKEPTS